MPSSNPTLPAGLAVRWRAQLWGGLKRHDAPSQSVFPAPSRPAHAMTSKKLLQRRTNAFTEAVSQIGRPIRLGRANSSKSERLGRSPVGPSLAGPSPGARLVEEHGRLSWPYQSGRHHRDGSHGTIQVRSQCLVTGLQHPAGRLTDLAGSVTGNRASQLPHLAAVTNGRGTMT